MINRQHETSVFLQIFDQLNQTRSPKMQAHQKWIYVPYDQLSLDLFPLCRATNDLGHHDFSIILIESKQWFALKPYHQQRIAFLIANQRFFALECLKAGFEVDYLICDELIDIALQNHLKSKKIPQIHIRTPAEKILRDLLLPLKQQNQLIEIPHQGWLSTQEDFLKSCGETPPWKMDSFYKHMRKKLKIFVDEKNKPLHGKWSMDEENRLPWKGTPTAPNIPTFQPHPIKQEIQSLISTDFAHHPGQVDFTHLPCSIEETYELWDWAKINCLPHFGPYEDAMHTQADSLFHSRLSASMNISRILSSEIIKDILALKDQIPYPSLEGFIRQIIGWREYMYQVHWFTDGFRQINGEQIPHHPNQGSLINKLNHHNPLPKAYWGETSGFHCLDTVVAQVMREGWSHHITRLMVLSNWASLLGIDPRMITDWFWVCYVDAFDWVVEGNVLGMGVFATGELLSTKPYISGSAYLQKMSNYCQDCQYDPKTNCPMTRLYWHYLSRHEKALSQLHRMQIVLASMRKRSQAEKDLDLQVYQDTLKRLKMDVITVNQNLRAKEDIALQ
jgi:deoxyribodipyrimidine photolyase-related protein